MCSSEDAGERGESETAIDGMLRLRFQAGDIDVDVDVDVEGSFQAGDGEERVRSKGGGGARRVVNVEPWRGLGLLSMSMLISGAVITELEGECELGELVEHGDDTMEGERARAFDVDGELLSCIWLKSNV